jgi:protein phosphatase 2C family protein 2/3
MIEEPSQKRSLSEKIYTANGRNRPDIMADNPRALIRFLTTQSKFLPEFDKPRVITKNYNIINSFAVTTHRGTVRNYNEDRVSVLLNVQQGQDKGVPAEDAKSYSLFSIFDGHGGYGCCNFLKDHLHNKLLESCDFESQNPPNLANIYKALDYQYIKSAIDGNHKFSGSCATTVVITPKFGLAINVGDSRVFCSKKNGAIVYEITKDHKPERPSEFNRVIKNNGELYRMSANQKTGEERYYFIKQMTELERINQIEEENPFIIFGPWRVKPGGLSVSRTFGDVESKMQSLGGLNGTVICEPETFCFDYEDVDFILMGCDGIFDKLTNEKVSETVWETITFYREKYLQDPSIYEQVLAECVNNILKRAMIQRSEDNLTVILLCFKNLFL